MRSTPAERQRRYRRRQRQGKRVLSVVADLAHVEAVLADAGYLPPTGSDDLDTIARALERAIENMVAVKGDA